MQWTVYTCQTPFSTLNTPTNNCALSPLLLLLLAYTNNQHHQIFDEAYQRNGNNRTEKWYHHPRDYCWYLVFLTFHCISHSNCRQCSPNKFSCNFFHTHRCRYQYEHSLENCKDDSKRQLSTRKRVIVLSLLFLQQSFLVSLSHVNAFHDLLVLVCVESSVVVDAEFDCAGIVSRCCRHTTGIKH